MKHIHAIVLLALAATSLQVPAFAAPAIEVVTTLSGYAAIAKEVGGDRVEVASISRGDEDAHFVKPKPSFALMLRDADLFVTTGLDLELWAPVLVDKSGNRKIRTGEAGYVSASEGVPLLDVPNSVDRSAGDVHIFGNPHILTSPLNAKIIAKNIVAGLKRVDPDGAAQYDANLERFTRRLDEALYGKELAQALGADVLDPLARQGKLMPFLESQTVGGKPLVGLLGGWLGKTRELRVRKLVAYHKNWVYFTTLFGLEVVDYVESKPGIPPSARHVHDLIETISQERIPVLLAASYFSAEQVATISDRTGCAAVQVPLGPAEAEQSYVVWFDELLSALLQGFAT